MRKTAYQIVFLLAVWGGLASGCAQERSLWQPSQPTKQEFESILMARWEQEYESVKRWGSFKWTNDVRTRCVHVPLYPAPDRSSKSMMPLAWHIDFIEGGSIKEDRARQLKQLDALVQAGVLKKSPTELEKDGVKITGVQYGLTLAGWKVTTTDKGPFCFMYGTSKFLGVKEITSGLVNAQAGLEISTVVAKSGLASGDLEVWARNEAVQAAFSEIKLLLEGEEQKRQFIRGGNGWIPYECLQFITMRKEYARMCESPQKESNQKVMANERDMAGNSDNLLLERDKFIERFEKEFGSELEKVPVSKRDELKAQTAQYINDLKSLSPPTEEEIKNLIRDKYEVGGAAAEFVGLKLYFNREYRFKFRIFLSYKLPPGRTLDPNVLAYRDDIRNMIEHGRACAGDFGFDVKLREQKAGSGSCWDAVDTGRP
jgi:hypothetical protein